MPENEGNVHVTIIFSRRWRAIVLARKKPRKMFVQGDILDHFPDNLERKKNFLFRTFLRH